MVLCHKSIMVSRLARPTSPTEVSPLTNATLDSRSQRDSLLKEFHACLMADGRELLHVLVRTSKNVTK